MNRLIFILLLIFGTQRWGYSQAIEQWRGPQRDGVYTQETGLLKTWPGNGPELLWYNDSLPKGYASVTVANNRVYTTGIQDNQDVVIALDMKGNLLWKVPYGKAWDSSYSNSRSTPTIEDNRLYVSSGLGHVTCLNAITGEIIWQVNATEEYKGTTGKFGIAESLLIVDDKLIYTPGGDETTVVALNKYTGKNIWKSPAVNDAPSYTSPLLVNYNGKQIIATLTTNYFIGVNAQNGNMLWKFDFGSYAGGKNKRNNQANTPLFYQDCFYLTSGYDHKSVMLQLADDATSVSVKWVDSTLDVHHGGVVLVDGYIYGANWINNRMGNWVCLNWETGKVMYNHEWQNKGSIISADNMLYCYDEKYGNIALVPANPEKFEIKGSFEVPYGKGPHWAHLVIKDAVLYVRHENAVMAYDIANDNE